MKKLVRRLVKGNLNLITMVKERKYVSKKELAEKREEEKRLAKEAKEEAKRKKQEEKERKKKER